MLEGRTLVINTGPILALTAALGDLSILDELYDRTVVPKAVADEIIAGGKDGFGLDAFFQATFLDVQERKCQLDPFLSRALDEGEAAVIQTAGDASISRVCIDEAAGRRTARLYGLSVTGSLGILIKSIKGGSGIDLELCIKKMRVHGVWIGEQTVQKALLMTSNGRDAGLEG